MKNPEFKLAHLASTDVFSNKKYFEQILRAPTWSRERAPVHLRAGLSV
jgi:hypothetical protein